MCYPFSVEIEEYPSLERVVAARARGGISEPTFQTLLEQLTLPPDKAKWIRHLRFWLLVLGFSLIVSGVLYFGAFNWDQLTRFQKFGLVEALITAFFAGSLLRGLETPEGKVLLSGAAALVGGLLAVMGQAYQTGADSYLLFGSWALLIAAWVLVGRFNFLWVLEIALLNTTFVLWWQQVVSDRMEDELAGCFLGLNLILAGAWHLARRNRPWMHQAITELLLFVALAPISLLASSAILDLDSSALTLVWVLLTNGALVAVRRDSVATAATVSASMMCLVTAFSIKLCFDWLNMDITGILMVGLAIVAQIAAVVKWLRFIQDRNSADSVQDPPEPESECKVEHEPERPPAERLAALCELPLEETRTLYGPQGVDLPWYAQTLVGCGAWVASLFVMLFFLVWVWNQEVVLLFCGLALYGGSMFFNRAENHSGFVRHALLTAHLTGVMVSMIAVAQALEEITVCAMLGFGMLACSVWKYRDNLGQFLFGLGLVGTGMASLAELDDHLGLVIWLPLVAIVLCYTGLQHRRFLQTALAPGWLAAYKGVATGFLVLTFIPMVDRLAPPQLMILAASLSLCATWLCLKLRHPVVAVAGLIAVGMLTYTSPSLMAGILVYLLGFASHQRLLQGLGLTALTAGCFFYYYNLELDLFTKSCVLVVSGAIFLGLRLYLKLHTQPEEPALAL